MTTPFDTTEFFRRGDARRREVLGDEFVDRSNASSDAATKVWRQFAGEVAWGQVWTRPGIDLRTRSLTTVAALVAVGDTREMRTHMRGALRIGITPEELSEVIIQVACYTGMPRGGAAFDVLRELVAEFRPGETASP